MAGLWLRGFREGRMTFSLLPSCTAAQRAQATMSGPPRTSTHTAPASTDASDHTDISSASNVNAIAANDTAAAPTNTSNTTSLNTATFTTDPSSAVAAATHHFLANLGEFDELEL